MPVPEEQLQNLLRRPAESLQVELKTWLDPKANDGIAKLVRAMFALRNRNGGFLLVGFDNNTLQPDPYSLADDVQAAFHQDVVQGLVGRYVAQPFEVEVALREVGGQVHPVIVVPQGVRVPAVVKADLIVDGGKKLLAEGELFFRTLRANGTPSSARIRPADYADLLEICFDNREADIGRFIRKQLTGLEPQRLLEALTPPKVETGPSLEERAKALMAAGESSFRTAVHEPATRQDVSSIALALTMRVAVTFDPPRPDELPNREFLNRAMGANPQYTGWPMWLDSRGFKAAEEQPRVTNGAWEALIVELGEDTWGRHCDFERLDPRGELFLWRVMQDDLSPKVPAGEALDPILMIYRVAEAIAVACSIGKATGWSDEDRVGLAFLWTNLKGRTLSAWANTFRYGGPGGHSNTATAEAYVELPVGTPHTAIAPFVSRVVAPLFSIFDGASVSLDEVETYVRKMVERNMD